MAADDYYRNGRGSQRGSGAYAPSENPYESQPRLAYEAQTPFYPPPVGSSLQVPDSSRGRPRSMPPGLDRRRSSSYDDRGRDRDRGYNPEGDSDDSDDGHHRRRRHHDGELVVRDRDRDVERRDRTPVGKARQVLDNTFSTSRTGVGVGVLGALVGGLVAHEAASRHHGDGRHGSGDNKRNQLLTTAIGAAVGALGANAVEKRIEVGRERREQRDRDDRDDDYDDDYRRDSATRRSRSRLGDDDRDYDDRRRSRGSRSEREVDPDARSWKNVEDWVYDERSSGHNRDRSRNRSDRY